MSDFIDLSLRQLGMINIIKISKSLIFHFWPRCFQQEPEPFLSVSPKFNLGSTPNARTNQLKTNQSIKVLWMTFVGICMFIYFFTIDRSNFVLI